MIEPYAEVIGDPIDHSLSPAIHRHWLRQLGLPGDFRAARCTPEQLPDYLVDRFADPAWRGCSVTMPLKERAFELACRRDHPLLVGLDGDAGQTGAVNCVRRIPGALNGWNTDVEGVIAAIGAYSHRAHRALILGGGGAAAAAVVALDRCGITPVVALRSPARARDLRYTLEDLAIIGFDDAPAAIASTDIIVNATPLGMAGAPPMPEAILAALRSAPGALAFDMVYRPLETPFLRAAAAAGLSTADGLNMLIGQARRAFWAIFEAVPPLDDDALYSILVEQLRAG